MPRELIGLPRDETLPSFEYLEGRFLLKPLQDFQVEVSEKLKSGLRQPGHRSLDVHTIKSVYLGDDEFGHARFDTKRSAVGELLYRLKYKGDQGAVAELAETAASFVQTWLPEVVILVPVPPSRTRAVQPVLVLAAAIAGRLGVACHPEAVSRRREAPELKDVFGYDERWRLLDGLHEVVRATIEGKRVLLFDDLFRSGATMNSITVALYEQGHASDVYALTLTQTRSKG
jgi:predicted amidophosphoribosyltransferase